MGCAPHRPPNVGLLPADDLGYDDLAYYGHPSFIFTSDNGACSGGSTGGLCGMKVSAYPRGERVPCIARRQGKSPPPT